MTGIMILGHEKELGNVAWCVGVTLVTIGLIAIICFYKNERKIYNLCHEKSPFLELGKVGWFRLTIVNLNTYTFWNQSIKKVSVKRCKKHTKLQYNLPYVFIGRR